MAIDPTAFERYRRSPNEKTTLPRLIAGTVIVAVCWLVITMAVVFAGAYGWMLTGEDEVLTFDGGNPLERFLTTSGGLFATLATFAGIWLGVWIAMRLLHREKLSRLFGNSARLSGNGFLKGFVAVVITSLLTELGYLLITPDVGRGPVEFGAWLLFLLPILLLAFVQTSSEELLFRGYLQRGLAHRFRSPLIWAVLPTVVFTALHWNPASVLGMNIGVAISIGAFAALLALLVYATGNLGAAMGAHLGNNLVGFLFISHDDALGGLALFRGAPLTALDWTPAQTAMIAGISIASILATWLLLMHPRSPLRVTPDLG
ncbi:type II CAAX endopeptidase family protein [Mesorhizobium sp. KR9-304]|uniref:CPBP family intramembrane glutamic endopeptidase n=1 Tax=Mesorhizobium sp. KR9-304 TaxID=3156614 RepID=UPI0032B486C5